jgi:hypothetical protein
VKQLPILHLVSFECGLRFPAISRCAAIYGVKGRLVTTLINGEIEAGWQSLTWEASDSGGRRVTPGVYFLRFESAEKAVTRKIVTLR